MIETDADLREWALQSRQGKTTHYTADSRVVMLVAEVIRLRQSLSFTHTGDGQEVPPLP